jgi:O-antigen/teichoic acid export membrane protein
MPNTIKTIPGGRAAQGSAARSVAWSYAGYVFQIAVNLGTTAYVVRRVSVAEYGLLLFVLSLSASLYLLDMGISGVLVQSYVTVLAGQEKGRLNELISTAFWALAMLGFVGVVIFSAIAAILPGPFNIPQQYVHEAAIIFVIAALVIQVSLPRGALEQVYQASNRYDRINQIQLLTTAVQFVLSVAVLLAGYRIVALAIVQLVTALLSLALLILALPASVPQASLGLTGFKWALLKPVMNLGKWAFIDNLGFCLFNVLVWSILGSFSSLKEVAMFGLAARLPTQLRNAVEKGAHVALPLLSDLAVKNEMKGLQEIFFRTQKLVFGAILPFIVLGCVFAGPLIAVWAGNEYVQAALVMQLLLFGALGDSIAYSSGTLLYASSQVKRAAWMSLVLNAVSIGAVLLTASRYGAVGVAGAIAITQLILGGGWFTFAACRVCRGSPIALARDALNEVAIPGVLMILLTVIVVFVGKALPPLWLVLAAAAIGCTYLLVWSSRAAIPLFRRGTETVL